MIVGLAARGPTTVGREMAENRGPGSLLAVGRGNRRAIALAIWFTLVAAIAGLAGSALAAERAMTSSHLSARDNLASAAASTETPGSQPDALLGSALRQAGEQASLSIVAVLAFLSLVLAVRARTRLGAVGPAPLSPGRGPAVRLRGPPLLQVA